MFPTDDEMRMNLKVPFAEKDEAKKLGARWDAARKLWYVDNKPDMAAFSRWAPTPHDGAEAAVAAPKGGSAGRSAAAAGKLVVGSGYVEQPRICECPPWEVCAKCESLAFPGRSR